MRSCAIVLGSILVFAMWNVAAAADLNGKWKGTMQTPDGQALEVNFTFQVAGEKLTGTVSNTYGEEQIAEGVVKDDDISFVVNAGGGQFKITYKGKATGDDIKFTVSIADMGSGELTATRVK